MTVLAQNLYATQTHTAHWNYPDLGNNNDVWYKNATSFQVDQLQGYGITYQYGMVTFDPTSQFTNQVKIFAGILKFWVTSFKAFNEAANQWENFQGSFNIPIYWRDTAPPDEGYNQFSGHGVAYIDSSSGTSPGWQTVNCTNALQWWVSTQTRRMIEIRTFNDRYGVNILGTGSVYWTPYIYVWYGYNLAVLTGSSTIPRRVDVSWTPVEGGDRYKVECQKLVGGVPTGGITTEYTTGSSWHSTASPLMSGDTYRITVTPQYKNPFNESLYWDTGSLYQDVTVLKGTPNVPVAEGDVPWKKQVRITKPPDFYQNSSWDYEARKTDETVVRTDSTSTDDPHDMNLMEQPVGTYRIYQRARYSDGDTSNWSAKTDVTITQPAITNLTASQTQYRSITASWDKLADAASYNVSIDGGGAISVSQPSGAIVSYSFGCKSGDHTIQVTPVYTNGYVGTVDSATVTGHAMVPQPNVPTVVGDTPLKRQIRVTAPPYNGSSLPSAFYSAASWDVIRDGNESTLINFATGTTDLSAVPSGLRSVSIRARWSDGDVSAYSGPAYATVTSPPVTDVYTRHTDAPTALPSTSFEAGGSLTIGESYYIGVSINYAGDRTTETVQSVPRAINETSPNALQSAPIGPVVSGQQTIRVSKPAGATGSHTWNVYIGRDKGIMKHVVYNLSSATATYDITSLPTLDINDSRAGQGDLQWVAPTGVGDNPTTYKVEMARATPNTQYGVPTPPYTDVTSTQASGLYGTGSLRFYVDKLSTGWWFFRVTAVYSNDQSSAVETLVRV